MNPNTEYEKFTQEIYQQLLNEDFGNIKTVNVLHNVKLKGRSGQEHQIDVYWEYEMVGIMYKTAIECKNYKHPISVGKIRDFYGVLSDLNNVIGIMVTKEGYQKGSKEYARHYGINLKELRQPKCGESIIAKIELSTHISVRHCLFLVDDVWAKDNGYDFSNYKRNLDMMGNFGHSMKWAKSLYIPLQTKNDSIKDSKGRVMSTLKDLEAKLPEEFTHGSCHVFKFQEAFLDTIYGIVKIKEVKFEEEEDNQIKIFALDAREFIKAILKDAITGEIKHIVTNPNRFFNIRY
jgi:Restriction endonuclease.